MTQNIQAALTDAYIDGNFGLSTAYENRKFEPVKGTAWASLYILPAQPFPGSLGPQGDDIHTGIMQITLYYPENTGTGIAIAKADAISAVFKAGARFTYSSQEVIITSCGRRSGRNENGWYSTIISIEWWAQVPRS